VSADDLTDDQIDADLMTIPGLLFDPDDSYPEYSNNALRMAYRAGYEAAS
jgi:hypothetical protein